MKLRSIIKGKRGGILGSALSNFWAYITFVFVVIIFFIFFSIQRGDALDNRIESLNSKPNLDIELLNYLRTPIIHNGQEKIFADFIIESLIESEYETEAALASGVSNPQPFRNKIEPVIDQYFPDTHIDQKYGRNGIIKRVIIVGVRKSKNNLHCLYDGEFPPVIALHRCSIEKKRANLGTGSVLLPIPPETPLKRLQGENIEVRHIRILELP